MDTKKPVLNKELLAKVRDAIAAAPALFNIRGWARDAQEYLACQRDYMPPNERWAMIKDNNVCGTICCIAGHAIRIAAPDTFNVLTAKENNGLYVHQDEELSEQWETNGKELLGLTEGQAERLFYQTDWPQPFYRDMNVAFGNPKAEAKVAVAFLTAVIETDGQILTSND